MVVQKMECEHEGTNGVVEDGREVKSEEAPLYDANFASYLAYVYQQSLSENLFINSQVKNAQNIYNKQAFINRFDSLKNHSNQNFHNKDIQNNYSNSPQYPLSKSPSPVPEDLRIDRKKQNDLNHQNTPPLSQHELFKTSNSAINNPVNLSNHLYHFNNNPVNNYSTIDNTNYPSTDNNSTTDTKPLDHTLYSTQEIAKMIASELRRYGIPQAVFSERVLGRSQGTLSDLLRNPKPWNKLKAGKETFRRMLEWLNQTEHERLQVLKDASLSSKNEKSRRSLPTNGQTSSNTSPSTHSPSPSHPFPATTSNNNPKNTPINNPNNNTDNNNFSFTPIPSSSRSISSSSKKPRLVFTEIQRRTLNAIFKEVRRPNRDVQITIAQQLNLKLSTVSNFFMNARRRSLDKFNPNNNNTFTNGYNKYTNEYNKYKVENTNSNTYNNEQNNNTYNNEHSSNTYNNEHNNTTYNNNNNGYNLYYNNINHTYSNFNPLTNKQNEGGVRDEEKFSFRERSSFKMENSSFDHNSSSPSDSNDNKNNIDTAMQSCDNGDEKGDNGDGNDVGGVDDDNVVGDIDVGVSDNNDSGDDINKREDINNKDFGDNNEVGGFDDNDATDIKDIGDGGDNNVGDGDDNADFAGGDDDTKSSISQHLTQSAPLSPNNKEDIK